MNTKRRRFINTLLPLGLLLPAVGRSAGGHGDGPFDKLDPPHPTSAPGKIEVLEFFWYGCPHCAQVEPLVQAWKKTLPPDVLFRSEHVIWASRPDTVAHARLFATLKALNLLDAHQQAVFEAVHRDRTDFKQAAALADWLGRRGIDRAAFDAATQSFGVQTMVARMKALTQTYKIESVPTFFVNGRYSTEPHRTGGERQMFSVMDRLIAQERALLRK